MLRVHRYFCVTVGIGNDINNYHKYNNNCRFNSNFTSPRQVYNFIIKNQNTIINVK